MNKDILKKWYFWVIIVLIIAIILVIVFEENKNVGDVPVSSNVTQQENVEYTVVRNIFENGGKKKTEKIVIANKNISNDEIEEIYNERKIQNRDVELTIWLFSNEENANKLKEKEIKAKEHLEEMSELTRNLSYNDINLLKKNGRKKEDNNLEMENEKDKEQREK